ncbi:Complex 1 LYR protein [Cynara cardunculus var. scolymus]|uniref:NADH dehydrogenase [ubiquinone] 1 beta subcomplex subunit 9 n=1 Tax=Cynara cardunculus var. scolymus TaxID=59895 RepID=A0A118K2C7_CYNCS|nr:Complex 1 LYR protein [Cynara cardunculus var. scolymus]
MSGVASYMAKRAVQKERVRTLYRRALKDTLNWAVHRHLFYPDADALRERFDANKHVDDIDTIDRMIADVPWAPGGSKFTRNPTPPTGYLIMVERIKTERNLDLMAINNKKISRVFI